MPQKTTGVENLKARNGQRDQDGLNNRAAVSEASSHHFALHESGRVALRLFMDLHEDPNNLREDTGEVSGRGRNLW
jgi:hypothetical protein